MRNAEQPGVGPVAAALAQGRAVRVFISYAHDDAAHDAAVHRLWLFLRENGIDTRLDLTAAQRPQDWPLWMLREVRRADVVLVVASPAYKRRAEGDAGGGEGSGVQWEAGLIRQEVYADRATALLRFLPVLLPGHVPVEIPSWLGPTTHTHYTIDDYSLSGAEALLRYLTGQDAITAPALGTVPVLAPHSLLDSTPAATTSTKHDGGALTPRLPRHVEAQMDGTQLGLRFRGELFYDKVSLAQAFAESWNDATQRFLVGAYGRNPSQAWLVLREWLQQFDDAGTPGHDSLIDLLDEQLLKAIPPDVKMIHLLRWLDPALPPTYRGAAVGPHDLAALACAAVTPSHPHHSEAGQIVADLWQRGLLPLLALMPGGGMLTEVDARWRSLRDELGRRAESVLPLLPRSDRPDPAQRWFAALLLHAASDPNEAAAIWAQMRADAKASVAVAVPWFDDLVHACVTGTVDDLLVVAAAPAAAAHAQAELDERARAASEQAERQRVWAAMEEARLRGRRSAGNRAVLYVVGVAGVMALVLVLGYSPPVILSLLTGTAVIVLIAVTEVIHASAAAGQYRAYAPFCDTRGAVSRIRRRGSTLEHGCATLVIGVTALELAISLPPLLFYLAVAGLHLRSWFSRRRRWKSAHERQRAQTLDPAALQAANPGSPIVVSESVLDLASAREESGTTPVGRADTIPLPAARGTREANESDVSTRGRWCARRAQ